MGDRIFFEVFEKDYYARHFDLCLSALPDRDIHITAQCSEPDTPRARERYAYYLEIYFSVDDLDWIKFLTGFAFGGEKQGKEALDNEITYLVLEQVRQPGFLEEVRRYLRAVQFSEDSLEQS